MSLSSVFFIRECHVIIMVIQFYGPNATTHNLHYRGFLLYMMILAQGVEEVLGGHNNLII
jgi:hypothetical protein